MTTIERSETPEADKAMWTCDPDGMGDYRDVVDYEFACSLETRLRKAETELAALRVQLENERQKVAGCSTAAIGYWKEGDALHPNYECAAIHDVARIYAQLTALRLRYTWKPMKDAPRDKVVLIKVRTPFGMDIGLAPFYPDADGWMEIS